MRLRRKTMDKSLGKAHGFTIIEMAVVLLIVGLLLGGLFTSLGDSSENRRRSEATADLSRIEESLYGFAQSNGRLPCPAWTSVSLPGQEYVSGTGCGSYVGFVPALTLGLQGATNNLGFLLDPWGNPYRYSVASLTVQTATMSAFANATGLRSRFAGAASTGGLSLCVAAVPGCNTAVVKLTDIAPALVFSMGSNTTITSATQAENVGATSAGFLIPGDNEYVDTVYVDPDSANAFDDIILWLSPNILFTKLISAGQLP